MGGYAWEVVIGIKTRVLFILKISTLPLNQIGTLTYLSVLIILKQSTRTTETHTCTTQHPTALQSSWWHRMQACPCFHLWNVGHLILSFSFKATTPEPSLVLLYYSTSPSAKSGDCWVHFSLRLLFLLSWKPDFWSSGNQEPLAVVEFSECFLSNEPC